MTIAGNQPITHFKALEGGPGYLLRNTHLPCKPKALTKAVKHCEKHGVPCLCFFLSVSIIAVPILCLLRIQLLQPANMNQIRMTF